MKGRKTTSQPAEFETIVSATDHVPGARGTQRKFLDRRLQSLYRRTAAIENELVKLDDNRFYRVCIFGSARIKPGGVKYNQVFELSRLLAAKGMDILTGGGPGLMEAANSGAVQGRSESKNKSKSFGLSIELPWEPDANHHLDVKRHHHRFSSRLDDFMRLSQAIVCTQGGIGTLLELFFAWQLVQVQHISMRPIILLDREFWSGIVDWMKQQPMSRGLISEKDFNCLSIVDTEQEVVEILEKDFLRFKAVGK